MVSKNHLAEELAGTVKPVIPVRLLKAPKRQERAKDVSNYQLKRAGDKGRGENDSL